jgi:hypothetical protein
MLEVLQEALSHFVNWEQPYKATIERAEEYEGWEVWLYWNHSKVRVKVDDELSSVYDLFDPENDDIS